MKWKLTGFASLLAMLSIDMYTPPVDACGVKLALKVQRPRKVAARSARPSHLLLVGDPPKRLEHDLAAAGHDVEVVASPSVAKRPSYEVVVVASNDQATEARAKFPDATVVVRSGDVTADVRSVESQVGRMPVRADESRTVIAAGPSRAPVAARQAADTRRVVAAKEPTETRVAAKEPGPAAASPPPAPKQVATKAEEPPAKAKPEPKPESKVATKAEEPPAKTIKPEPKQVATTAKVEEPAKPKTTITNAILDQELYFGSGSASVDNKKSLEAAAKWLKDHADIHAVIEGHADPTGSHDANMTLSQSRAESVRDFLVSSGIEESRLEVKPFGDTQLKYKTTDPRNRRVAIEAKQ